MCRAFLTGTIGPLMIQPCMYVWFDFKLVVKDLKTRLALYLILIEEKRRKADEKEKRTVERSKNSQVPPLMRPALRLRYVCLQLGMRLCRVAISPKR